MASGMDMKAAERSYDNFITLVKWGTPLCAIVALVVLVLIAN